ncbi:glutamate receptor 2.7-like [Senna tora]|uniref:Glutamate receptor 2.7-like n=1 Tax=Senna tora TaxID=362788 RepID=A0A834U1W7_9FABA|nr:glutamate receptor 2.7-like [Senna tora]
MIVNIGAIIDSTSRVGKEQKTALEMAIQDVNHLTCFKLVLNYFNDPYHNHTDLAQTKQVQLIIETKLNGATLVPIMSLTPIQLATDFTLNLQCIAGIVEQFRWRKVTAIYEHNHGFFSNSDILTHLSYYLRSVHSEIDHHVAFPSLTSLLDPKATIEAELTRLKNKSNRVFLVIQSSLEFSILLFERAKDMGLMEKGSVWIIADDVASHLDSLDSSVTFNMQGVVGCKTNFVEISDTFKRFKLVFRRKFGLEYPEEENPHPSVFALRAYDAIWVVAHALNKSQGNISSLSAHIMATNLVGLSGKLSFKDRKLMELAPTYKVVNVIGRSYKELAYWSEASGLSENLAVYWPGGSEAIPKGWVYSSEEKPLKIGFPAKDPCPQFVNVSYDLRQSKTYITGFSINVFRAVVKHLPYHLPYELVAFNGTYDELVEQVNKKVLDAAVGDIQIIDNRYANAEFSHPYLESGIWMIARVKPDRSKETWMFMDAFTKEMWLLMAMMHMLIGFAIWFIESEDNPELRGFRAMLWFFVTILFFVDREPVRSNLARIVLAPWLFAILIVSASFTASLSSMMTVSQLEPSVPDVQTLLRTNAVVGCNKKTFLVDYLIKEHKFKAENIRGFDSIADFPKAFENKEIKAAFTISPHARAFPKGSPMAYDISRAVLKAIESGEVERLERDMLSNTDCGVSESNSKIQDEQLGPRPFFGLFYISGGIASLAFTITFLGFVGRNVQNIRNWIHRRMRRNNEQTSTVTIELPTINNNNHES